MMGRIEKTVFISYRRTNVPWALAIYQNLTMHGYDVFFDYQSIDSGNFEKVILENIKTRAHFLIILTPSALERCKEPGDWLRREIETAMDERRNIVPLMLESFDFGTPLVKEALTGKLGSLNTFNGLRVYSEYFFEAMDKLRDRYLNVAVSDIALPAINLEAKEITDTQKSAANEASPVEKEQLTAQEWFERGYISQQAKNWDEAIRCYSEAIKLDPSYAPAYSNLGVILHENLKRYEAAEATLRKAIKLNPSEAIFYFNLGNLLHDKNLNRNEEAELTYHKAIELDPFYAPAYSNFGIVLVDLGRYEEAEIAYRKAIELEPADGSYYFNLGNLLSDKNLNRYKEAEVAYSKAVELDPSITPAYSSLGNVLADLGRYEEAEVAYNKAVELNPSSNLLYYNLGNVLANLARDEEAEVAYRKAIDLDPSYAPAYTNLGNVLVNLARYEEAEVAYNKAVELNPSNGSDYSNLGNLLARLGRYEEAEVAHRKAIETNPLFAVAYFNFGNLLIDLERINDAEVAYSKAIELDPSLTKACTAVAMLLHRYKQSGNALRLLKTLTEVNPENFITYLAIASIMREMDNPVSTEIIDRARQLVQEDNWYDRACLEGICNNFDLAFEYLQRAVLQENFDPSWAWDDPDLQWIRDDPRFTKIIGPRPMLP